jgi:hypothetical protein
MNKTITSYFVAWEIPATYFTRGYIIEEKVFSTRKERTNYIINRKKKWWEYLPFITKVYWVD